MSQPIPSCESISPSGNRQSQYKANPLLDNPERLYASQPDIVDRKQRFYAKKLTNSETEIIS